jgi:hypothetical protein
MKTARAVVTTMMMMTDGQWAAAVAADVACIGDAFVGFVSTKWISSISKTSGYS